MRENRKNINEKKKKVNKKTRLQKHTQKWHTGMKKRLAERWNKSRKIHII